MSDNPLSQSFGGTITDREDLEEFWKDVEAFAGTLADQFDGDIRIEFTVSPELEVDDNDN